MEKITFGKEFFNIKSTLECGQIFRYTNFKSGYIVFSLNKCAYCREDDNSVIIECNNKDLEYFYNFFDLTRNYEQIYSSAINQGINILKESANAGKGIRILNQNPFESLISFIVSQNNNIPRIKGIIEKLCTSLGECFEFDGKRYYSFPSAEKMAKMDKSFYESLGLGYRAEYLRRLAVDITNGYDLEALTQLSTKELKCKLQSIYGVGPKVADCALLFGFHKTDCFPVDTWIEKVYRQDVNGSLTDRRKISEFFVDIFGDNAGYFQQYLFYYKRSIEKSNINSEK